MIFEIPKDTEVLQIDITEVKKQIRADAIEELKTELIDIIQGNEEFIDWQKEEICLCLECAIETVKEHN